MIVSPAAIEGAELHQKCRGGGWDQWRSGILVLETLSFARPQDEDAL
jgi:hypothetical protein